MLNIKTLALGAYETNCYIIWDENSRECLVIDPGYEPERVLSTVKALDKTVAAILLTHGHFDHVGGVKGIAQAVRCPVYLSEADLVTWVNKQALTYKRKMSKDAAYYFINVCDKGINTLQNEFDKLLNYCGEEITKNYIDNVVSKSLEVQIFDLTDAIMRKDANAAMEVVSSIRTSNESALGILYLINSTAEKMLHAKLLKGESVRDIAAKLGTAPFIAGKYVDGAKAFSEEALKRMVMRIPEIDYEIKQGNLEMWTGVEQYIAECIYYQ